MREQPPGTDPLPATAPGPGELPRERTARRPTALTVAMLLSLAGVVVTIAGLVVDSLFVLELQRMAGNSNIRYSGSGPLEPLLTFLTRNPVATRVTTGVLAIAATLLLLHGITRRRARALVALAILMIVYLLANLAAALVTLVPLMFIMLGTGFVQSTWVLFTGHTTELQGTDRAFSLGAASIAIDAVLCVLAVACLVLLFLPACQRYTSPR